MDNDQLKMDDYQFSIVRDGGGMEVGTKTVAIGGITRFDLPPN